MPFPVTEPNDLPFNDERARARTLAKKLGVEIPSSIGVHFWMLPLLEKLVERVEKLEKGK